MANNEQAGNARQRASRYTIGESVPGGFSRKTLPMASASGPFEYTPGDQEGPVQLTSVAEMLQ